MDMQVIGNSNTKPTPAAGSGSGSVGGSGPALTSGVAAGARPACACPLNFAPVCASADGGKTRQTFPNGCAARCNGAVVAKQGGCDESEEAAAGEPGDGDVPPEGCMCTMQVRLKPSAVCWPRAAAPRFLQMACQVAMRR